MLKSIFIIFYRSLLSNRVPNWELICPTVVVVPVELFNGIAVVVVVIAVEAVASQILQLAASQIEISQKISIGSVNSLNWNASNSNFAWGSVPLVIIVVVGSIGQ